MLRFIFLLATSLLSLNLAAQATLYTETFEPPSVDWMESITSTPNSFTKSSCAGNGPSLAGSNSMHITKGGAIPGCGPTGQDQFAYDNSAAGILLSQVHDTIDATCASAIQVKFDYIIEGMAMQDFAELVYSTNNGSTWNVVGSPLPSSATWTTTTISLPAAVNFSTFLLGFRFTYDNAVVNGQPLAIDNIIVTGTDTQNPVITCPTSIEQAANATCAIIADDYTKSMVILSDNCTDSVNIIVTQSIPEFAVIPIAPGGSTSITLTAEDETGNTSQCTFTLNAIDDIDPVITVCPGDQNIYVNSACNGVVGNYAPLTTATDNCSGTITYTQSPIAGSVIVGQGINTTITITATDPFGNFDQCTLTATTIDTIKPIITCPATQSLISTVNCDAVLPSYTTLAVFSDNCVPSGSLTVNQSPLPGVTINANTTITFTLTGGIPATPVTCQFTVQLVDTIKPNVTCPVQSSIYVNSACDASIPNYTGLLGWTDNCTSVAAQMTFSQTPSPGTVVSNNQLITLTATDPSGNSRSCSITQLVFDTISPVLTCPGNQSVYSNASCVGVLNDYLVMVSSNENCFFTNAVSYSQSPVPGSTINGPTTITVTGMDESGNDGTCTFTVSTIDTISPTITCPSNFTVGTNSGCNRILDNHTSLAIINDNCTPLGSLTMTQTPIAGTILAAGTHNITLTVNDQAGNDGACTFVLTVSDQTLPTPSCPSSQNVPVDNNCLGTIGNYTSLVTLADNCSSPAQLTISQSPIPGTSISSNTPITMSVTDVAGNVGTCNFFALTIDNTDPVVNCPSTFDVAINSSCQYLVPDLSAQVTGTDNCSVLADMTISQSPAVGALENGITAVLITLTDEQGNNSTCITSLTPIDTEDPTITCPNPSPVNNGTNCNFTLPNYGSTALVLDNCADYTITQSPAVGSVVQSGSNAIQLTVTDAGGNTAQCTFDLQVNESISPTITCPANISTCNPLVNYTDPIYNDNCFASMEQTDVTGLSSGDIFPVGTTTLTYTVTDASSNTQSCSFQVQILEYPAPAVILDDTISLCGQSSTLIEAVEPISGTGEWSLLSGSVLFNNEFAFQTGLNNIAFGTNTILWTVSSPTCGSLTDTLIVIHSQQPLPASAMDTLYACNSSSVQLSASVPLIGIGTWSTNQGATIANVNSATSSVSNLDGGWNDFVWSITNGACPVTTDTMRIFYSPKAQINLSDTTICIENGDLLVSGTTPIPGQSVSWIFISGGGDIASPQSSTTSITDIDLGNNQLMYQISNPFCPTSTDTITIVSSLCDGFEPVFPTVITPNFDGKNDLFVINYLELIYPECKVTIFNRWGSIVFESVGYLDPWDGTYKGEPLPMGTYFYKIELNDEASTIYDGPISIIH